MVSKRVTRALIVLVAAPTLFLSSRVRIDSEQISNMNTVVIQDPQAALSGSSDTVEVNPTVTDLGDAYVAILDKGTKAFFGGYTVDESFLCWIQTCYGEQAIIDIANELSNENQDVNLWYQKTGNSIHVLWMNYCNALGYATYNLSNVKWLEATSTDKTTIDFIGDVNFDENWCTTEYMNSVSGGISDCISEKVQTEMKSADISMVNNEFTFSANGAPLDGKTYTFRAEPSKVKLLDTFGTDIVSLANNHVCDYGDQALLDTMSTIQSAGIDYIGAGANLNEATRIQYYIINGKKIAFVAATQIEMFSKYTKEATEDTPGVLKTLNPDKFVKEISEAKKHSDYVIAYVHWGVEGQTSNNASQRNLAEKFVEAGADVIIGGHPHRMQGAEFIDGVPVVYSLGNFWFSTGSLYTTIAQVEIDKEGSLTVKMIPCVQQNLTTDMITDETTKTEFYQYLADNSDNVAIDDTGVLRDASTADAFSNITYWSGSHYASYDGLKDLEGRTIDIVGNLK